jgi:tRNA(adenine34) deaminase
MPTKGASKSSAKKTHATRSGNRSGTPPSRRWSTKIRTESTHPEAGLFEHDAETIARRLASKSVSPKGPASGMRMLTFYINRAGKNLSTERKRTLERAKKLLHERIEQSHGTVSAKKKAA